MEPAPIDGLFLFLIIAGGAWGLIAGAVKVAGPFALILAVVTLTRAYPEVSTRFGADPGVQFFLLLLLGFIGLVIYGFVVRTVNGAVHTIGLGPLNRMAGLGLGLVTGTILAGAVVWVLKTHGGFQGRVLLGGSVLAPVVTEFFEAMMAFTQRLFPRPEAEPEKPWWKRPLF